MSLPVGGYVSVCSGQGLRIWYSPAGSSPVFRVLQGCLEGEIRWTPPQVVHKVQSFSAVTSSCMLDELAQNWASCPLPLVGAFAARSVDPDVTYHMQLICLPEPPSPSAVQPIRLLLHALLGPNSVERRQGWHPPGHAACLAQWPIG